MSEQDIEKMIADHAALQSENAVLKEELAQMQEQIVYAGIKTATTRTRNRTLPDLEPHFAGGKPHQFQIRDYTILHTQHK